MELNKTEDNKCCFLHFGRGVQDPLSGDQGGSLDPWTPPPPGSAPERFTTFPQRCGNVFATFEYDVEAISGDNNWITLQQRK